MAEQDDSERTEEPSQRKLEQAHEKGEVAKSQELVSWFSLAGVTLIVLVFANGTAGQLTEAFRNYLSRAARIPMAGGNLRDLMFEVALAAGGAIAFPLLIMASAGVIGSMVQHRLVFSTESLKPKFSKVSPLSGAKRLFSAQSLVNFAKGVAKLSLVAAMMVALLWPARDQLDRLVALDLAELLELVRIYVLKLLAAVLALMAFVAAADFAWQRHSFIKKQRMTQQEVKEEYKQSEGDPHVKAKIRQLRVERSRRRMMASVPQATVVVTNPTHYAVALKYDRSMPAPICVAKGLDAVALKIRAIAEEHDVPIIENPPLARLLYAAVDMDRMIEPEHYKAVAEIIGYVMQMKARKGWRPNRAGR